MLLFFASSYFIWRASLLNGLSRAADVGNFETRAAIKRPIFQRRKVLPPDGTTAARLSRPAISMIFARRAVPPSPQDPMPIKRLLRKASMLACQYSREASSVAVAKPMRQGVFCAHRSVSLLSPIAAIASFVAVCRRLHLPPDKHIGYFYTARYQNHSAFNLSRELTIAGDIATRR